MEQKPHSSALRKGRYSEAGRLYLITTVTQNRTPIFNDLWAARAVVRSLIKTEQLGFAETWAFVLMPDHLHWLMRLGEKATLSRVVGGVKRHVSAVLHAPVWQRGFHDHALRREEDVRALARYMIANPLRAGLAQRIGDYPHWDARWMREESR